jgi:hypothetical protein
MANPPIFRKFRRDSPSQKRALWFPKIVSIRVYRHREPKMVPFSPFPRMFFCQKNMLESIASRAMAHNIVFDVEQLKSIQKQVVAEMQDGQSS